MNEIYKARCEALLRNWKHGSSCSVTNLEHLADAGEYGGTDNVVQEELYRLRRSGSRQ